MKIDMRRSYLVLVLNALLLTMWAPAMADKPAEIPFDPAVFFDVDPCTGEEQLITIFFDTFVHEGHPNNLVDRGIRTGFTSAGYEMFAGTGIQLQNFNGGVFGDQFVDM